MIIQRLEGSEYLNQAWSTDSSWWDGAATSLIAVGKSSGKIYVSRMVCTNSSSSTVYVKDISIQGLVAGTNNYSSCRVFCTTSELTPAQAIASTTDGVTAKEGGTVSFTFNNATVSSKSLKAENIPVNSLVESNGLIYVYLVPTAGSSCSSWVVGGSTYQDGGGPNATGIISETIGYTLTVKYHSNGATTAKFNDTPKTDPICTETYYQYKSYSYGFDDYCNTSHIYVSKTGYHITSGQEWNTEADGTGTSVSMTPPSGTSPTGADLALQVGKNISGSNQTVDLYANWKPNTLTINYYSNKATTCGKPVGVTNPSVGANNNVKVATEDRKYNDGEDSLYNYDTLELTRRGYDNTGYWNTEVDGTGYSLHEDTKYTGGNKFAEELGKNIDSGNATVDIYAQWTAQTYTVSYDATGGKVNGKTTDIATATYDAEFTVASNVTRPGYQFLGWTTNSDGTPDGHGWAGGWKGQWTFIAGDYGITNKNLKLYAMWKSLATMFVKIDTNTWSAGTPFVKTANEWKRAIGVFVKTADGWKRSIR